MVEKQFGIQFLWISDPPTSENRKFMQGLREDLTQILKSRGGQILATSLRYQLSLKGRDENIIWAAPYQGDDCNAEANDSSPSSRSQVVNFTHNNPSCAKASGTAAKLSHEVLHHELVHALRGLSQPRKDPVKPGTRNFLLKDHLKKYTSAEEFYAILATNIFISDPSNAYKSALRVSHESHDPLPREQATSFGFFTLGIHVYNLVGIFCDQNPGYTKMLAKVPAVFNPISAFYKHPERAMRIAADAEADTYFDSLFDINTKQGFGFGQVNGVWVRSSTNPWPDLTLPPSNPALTGH